MLSCKIVVFCYNCNNMPRPSPETGPRRVESRTEQSPYEKLSGLLTCIAEEINQEHIASSEQPIVGEDCSLNTEAFQEPNGFYSEEEIIWDTQTARDNEISWASADNPRVQEFCIDELKREYKKRYGKEWQGRYEQDYGSKTPEEIVFENKKRSYGSLLEMAVTSVFYKMLKSEFLVVRSALYDDQQNGVDHLIVRRSDGALIGAFDEVNDERGGKRFEKKLERVQTKAQKGGTRVKYGITFERGKQGQLIKKQLRNVPTFYLPLSTQELKGLLADMSYDINQPPTKTEQKVFNQLVDFLGEQVRSLQGDKNIKGPVGDNLNRFASSLGQMKKISQGQKAAA